MKKKVEVAFRPILFVMAGIGIYALYTITTGSALNSVQANDDKTELNEMKQELSELKKSIDALVKSQRGAAVDQNSSQTDGSKSATDKSKASEVDLSPNNPEEKNVDRASTLVTRQIAVLEKKLEQEPKDSQWTAAAEKGIRKNLVEKLENRKDIALGDITCADTLCKVSLRLKDKRKLLIALNDHNLALSQVAPWNGALFQHGHDDGSLDIYIAREGKPFPPPGTEEPVVP